MKSYIYIEKAEAGIEPIAEQILSKVGKMPPDVRGPLSGICIGHHLKDKESSLSGLVDELIEVDVPSGSEYNTEVISNILTEIMKKNSPATLFMGLTHQGLEICPMVGWHLGIPVMTSCMALTWTQGLATVKRGILGGKLFVTSEINMQRGAVISVQKGAWKEERDENCGAPFSVQRLEWNDSWAAEKTRWMEISEDLTEGEEDIAKAEILVSVGRGLGDPDEMPIIEKLADELGGSISCSRPVVDLRWLPASRQVGISGKTVAPVVYLALGISGQTNHVAGMDASKTVIAINTDPSAPIFNVADYGVEEDILEFVPELIEQISRKKGMK